ncbi:MAG: hypothetical protein DGJ47_000704 [Rickettsiaceae bacterium]
MKDIKNVNVLGVGLGPSNLSLASIIQDRGLISQNFSCLFIDSKEKFEWHTGMLIPGMSLQVPFFRDLITTHNPKSQFTFLNYLKAQNRLDQFINLRTFYPTRTEFYDYLKWVYEQIKHLTEFGCEVLDIEPVFDNNKNIIKLKVNYLDHKMDTKFSVLTNNIILSIGAEPNIPNKYNDQRILHTANLLTKVPVNFPEKDGKYSFVVVGSGQSAGESVFYLMQNYPNSKISWCFRNVTLHSTDNSPLVNKLYHGNSIDPFYNLNNLERKKVHEDLQNSNYSVVDVELLNDIFKMQYLESLDGKNRLQLCPRYDFKEATPNQKYIATKFFDHILGKSITKKSDSLILATGYNKQKYTHLLKQLDGYLIKTTDNEYVINRNYSIQTNQKLKANIYLQGYCEKTHGPSDSTLAILPHRSNIILNSIIGIKNTVKKPVKQFYM